MFINYYEQIKNIIIDTEVFDKVKDYSKERNRVNSFYEIGKLLSEAGSVYGENIIGEYANRLIKDVGRKYDRSTLYKFKKFYLLLSKIIVAQSAPQLSWSHYIELLPLKDINAVKYYSELAIIQNSVKLCKIENKFLFFY